MTLSELLKSVEPLRIKCHESEIILHDDHYRLWRVALILAETTALINIQNRIKGYPTGHEWNLLVGMFKNNESKAIEILNGRGKL